ncbi:MAG TPA: hypothetical protein VEX63_11590 [Flavisolibacter sp.]|jgi:hypothetical protein|nr:hypothetical protein [Flavisolibacter sp.]HZI01783.1 hypothetical protein [Flavisolibacter sp.]
MLSHPSNQPEDQSAPKTYSGSTGNASNPNPNDGLDPDNDNQLLDSKAEKYIREVASIEDVPDAQDQQEMDELIEEEKRKA